MSNLISKSIHRSADIKNNKKSDINLHVGSGIDSQESCNFKNEPQYVHIK